MSHQNASFPTARTLRIAVVGGGLAGASTIVALSRLPNVRVRLYERAPAVREAGAQIALMVTAIKDLHHLLSPNAWARLQEVVYRSPASDGIHHRHWRTGAILATARSPHTPRSLQEGRTSRASLHRTLMLDVPEETVEYGRDVVSVETRQDRHGKKEAVLHFQTGEPTTVDLVVAADGLYSKLRKQYFPDTQVAYKGLVAYRINFAVSLLKHIPDLPDDSSSYKRGSDVVILSPLEPGTYSFAAFLTEPADLAAGLRWEHALGTVGVTRLAARLAGWHPLIGQVVAALPGIDAYPLQRAPWLSASSLTRDDRIAFVGDAAHPTAGGWGTGSAFCFGDAWALYRSLGRSLDRSGHYDIPYALHLFDETRRPFLHRVEKQFDYDVVDTQYVSAALTAGDDDEFVRRYRERHTAIWWITEHDVEQRWQEVEARERHEYRNRSASRL